MTTLYSGNERHSVGRLHGGEGKWAFLANAQNGNISLYFSITYRSSLGVLPKLDETVMKQPLATAVSI